MSAQPNRWEWSKHAIVLGVLCLELFPLYMVLQISLKDNAAFLASPWLPGSPGDWRFDNYMAAFRLLSPYLANSFFVAVAVTCGTLVLAVCAAYMFARSTSRLARWLWPVFILLMMLPGILNLVPLFALLRDLHLLNTLWALVLVGIAGGQAFNIYILRQFIADIPKELFEAAEIDGATHVQRIRHIVLPMVLPMLGTLGILTFLGTWNDFMLPLVVLRDPELFTVGVGLIYLDGEYVRQWGVLMSAFALAAAPLLVLFAITMRWFVRGLAAGAVKG
jgi:multiple sugar transport system permease protein